VGCAWYNRAESGNVDFKIKAYKVLLCLIAGVAICVFPAVVYAQQSTFALRGGDTLTVQGEDFVFEQVFSTVDGEQVVIERATWDGGVTAWLESESGRFTLETEHIEMNFDGANVNVLEAGPEVTVTGIEGKALFECADVYIDFPTDEAEAGIYSGLCNDVVGYYLADAWELGLEGDDKYQVNFTAVSLRLDPENAILERPCISLGKLDNPDLAIRSREIAFRIGPHPVTGDRDLLGARLANLSIDIFDVPLNIMPFPLWRGLVSRDEPGFNFNLPRFGWEGDQYLRIDMTPNYDFMSPWCDDGPRVIFRLDTFPFDRTYPEILVNTKWEPVYLEVRTGYRREEDSNYDPVPTRAEPEVTFGTERFPLGDSGFGFQAATFWGHLRDMNDGPDLDRWGWRAGLNHGGIAVGEFRLNGNVEFHDYYYDGGDNYQVFDGTVNLRYVDPPHWGTTLYYQRVYDWGETPFVFDEPQVMEQLGVREQSRFSRRWGAGFDWAWDFSDDDFERQECHLTYILDSLQISAGWDFYDESVQVRFNLPGSLR